ncbi:hypothetical protein [Streptomyces sp. NPDC001820]|uniref:hypothetical protein n=1 Tax=Streptomyces sp. NPDC001820 TaxID=3364613 RepID=UPI0036CC06E1
MPRTDSTIEAALAIVRDLARFLTSTRDKQDWPQTDVHDVEACLAHREYQYTDNPHVTVIRITRTGRAPASTAYVSHLLDPCGVGPRTLRSTRLADLVNTLAPSSSPRPSE